VSAWNLHGIGGAYLIVHTPIGSLAASELADLNSPGVVMKVTLRCPRRELRRKEFIDTKAVQAADAIGGDGLGGLTQRIGAPVVPFG
jgi:hypothetical protein